MREKDYAPILAASIAALEVAALEEFASRQCELIFTAAAEMDPFVGGQVIANLGFVLQAITETREVIRSSALKLQPKPYVRGTVHEMPTRSA